MDTNVEVVCPYCGQIVNVHVEFGGRKQRYHEDCEVCSRPMHVDVRFDPNYNVELQVRRSSGH